MKYDFWQMQIAEEDMNKNAFTIPFGHYEWSVIPFGLKNVSSEFQNIMNDIFSPYISFCIVYIDNVLIFSKDVEQHFKHINALINGVKRADLVISAKKIKLFQTEIRFLGHIIKEGTIFPIDRIIAFAGKFPDEIKEKTQLQRFLGSLNCIADFYKDLAKDAKPLFERLRTNPHEWSNEHTTAAQKIKVKIKEIPYLAIAQRDAFKIVKLVHQN